MYQERPLTVPAQHRLHLLYSDQNMIKQPKTSQKLGNTAEGDILRDFWDAKLYAEKGFLSDPRSLAFYFNIDGVCLIREGRQYTVYSLILFNHNLHTERAFEQRMLFA